MNSNDDCHSGLVVGITLLIIGASDYDFETADSMIFRRSLANIHRLCVPCTLFTPSCPPTAYKGGIWTKIGVVKVFCRGKGINLILHQRQKGQKCEEKVNAAKSGYNISRPSPQTAVRATVKACCGNDHTKKNQARGKPTVKTRAGVRKNTKKTQLQPDPRSCLGVSSSSSRKSLTPHLGVCIIFTVSSSSSPVCSSPANA